MNSDSGVMDRLLHFAGLGVAVCGLVLWTAPAVAEDSPSPRLTEQSPFHFDLAERNAPQSERLEMAALQEVLGPASDPNIDAGANDRLYAGNDPKHVSFGRQIGAVKWEIAAAAAWMTGMNAYKIEKNGGKKFHFQNEGWFGDDTINLGLDKLAHAWNSYWITDAIAARMRHKTGADNSALPAAAVAFGLMLYSEVWDAHKTTAGFSVQDATMNLAGASFSVLRNTVPGLKQKLDFRLLLMPNHQVYTVSGKGHFRQMRYLLALKLSGFEGMERSPFRFVELHVGYRATGFTSAEMRRGEPLKQRPFVGVGLNLNELFFPRPSGWAGKAASTALQYIQVPYTAYHADLN